MADEEEKHANEDLPDREQIFRYWVELRDVKNGSIRSLPLKVMTLFHLPTKRNAQPRPDEELLQLKDGSTVHEAKNLDELAAKLRSLYPDDKYERTLHQERDHQAEQRYQHALNELAKIVGRAAARQHLRDQGGGAL